MGKSSEKRSGLVYLDKESILQSGNVLAMTTDLVKAQDRVH